MKKSEIISNVEAILFAVGNSVSIAKLAEVLEVTEKELKYTLDEMQNMYADEQRGIELVFLEDSVQLGTKNSAYEYLMKIAKTPNRYFHILSVEEILNFSDVV